MAEQSNLIYQACVGDVPAFYDDCIASVARYCHRHGHIHIVQTEPVLKIRPLNSQRSENALRLSYLPVYEKENAFEYFDRYEKIAIIDADIYVTNNAPDIFDVDWRWNADGAEFFNMGVMLMDKGIARYLNGEMPERFIRRPEFERFVNGEGHWRWSTDQTLLNWWVKSSGMTVKHLDWRWNALYGGVRDVTQAYFVHFFLSAKMPRKGAEIPDIIRGL
jgi:hypothetical protein